MLRHLLPLALTATLVACAEDATPQGPADEPTPAPASAPSTTPAKTPSTSTAPSTETPTDTRPTKDITPEAAPVSTFCADRVQELGADKVVFCADFDDARTLSAWTNGVFASKVFTLDTSDGSSADVGDGALTVTKAAKTTARFIAQVPFSRTQTAHVSLDVTVTGAVRFFGLDGAVHMDAINTTQPRFIAHDAIDHSYLTPKAIATGQTIHVDMDVVPHGDTYSLVPLIDGYHLKNDTKSGNINYGAEEGLTIDLGSTATDADATLVFDNVLVTTS